MLRLAIRLKAKIDISRSRFGTSSTIQEVSFSNARLNSPRYHCTRYQLSNQSQALKSEVFVQSRAISDLRFCGLASQGGQDNMNRSHYQHFNDLHSNEHAETRRGHSFAPSRKTKKVKLNTTHQRRQYNGHAQEFARAVQREVKRDIRSFKKCEPESYVPGFKALLNAAVLQEQSEDGGEGNVSKTNLAQKTTNQVDLDSIKPILDRILENSERLTLDSHRDIFSLYTEMFHRSSFVQELLKRRARPNVLPESTLPAQWSEFKRFVTSHGIALHGDKSESCETESNNQKKTGKESREEKKEESKIGKRDSDLEHSIPNALTKSVTSQRLENNLKLAPNASFGDSVGEHQPNASRSSRPLVIVLSGATGVGKTFLSLELAHLLEGEVISADSVQVYKGLDVGSAKISKSEMRGIPHHLIDILDPQHEEYSAGRFYKDAMKQIKEVISRGKTPIVVGGTGMYLRWLLYGPPHEVPIASPTVSAASKYWVSLLRDSSSGEYYWNKMDRKERERRVDLELKEKVNSMTPAQIQDSIKQFENKQSQTPEERSTLLPWQLKLMEKQARKSWEKYLRDEIRRRIEHENLEPFMSILFSEFVQHQQWKKEVIEWILSYLKVHDTHRLEKALAHALSTKGQYVPRPYREQLQKNKSLLNELAGLEEASDSASICEREEQLEDDEWKALTQSFDSGNFLTPPRSWIEEYVPSLEANLGSAENSFDLEKCKSKDVSESALSLWDVRCLYLTAPRDVHSALTDLRCEQMISQGLYSECAHLSLKNLMGSRNVCSKSIGYRQIMEALSDPHIRKLWILLKERQISSASHPLNNLSWQSFRDVCSLDSAKRIQKLSQLLIQDCKFDREELELVIPAGRSHKSLLDDLKASTRRFSRKQHAWFKTEKAYRFITIPLSQSKECEGTNTQYNLEKALSEYKCNLSSLVPHVISLIKVPQSTYWRELLLEESDAQKAGRTKSHAFADHKRGGGPASTVPGTSFNLAFREGSKEKQHLALSNELLDCFQLICALVEVDYLPSFPSTPSGGECVASLIKQATNMSSFSAQTFPKRSQLEIFAKTVSLQLRTRIQRYQRRLRMAAWINAIADQVLHPSKASSLVSTHAAQGYVKYILSTGELPVTHSSKFISQAFFDSRLTGVDELMQDTGMAFVFDLKPFNDHMKALVSYLENQKKSLQQQRYNNIACVIRSSQKGDFLHILGSVLNCKAKARMRSRSKIYNQALFDHIHTEEIVSNIMRQRARGLRSIGEGTNFDNEEETEDTSPYGIVDSSDSLDAFSKNITYMADTMFNETQAEFEKQVLPSSKLVTKSAFNDVQQCSPQPFAPTRLCMNNILVENECGIERNVLFHYLQSTYELLKAMHRLGVWMPSLWCDLEVTLKDKSIIFDEEFKELQNIELGYRLPADSVEHEVVLNTSDEHVCTADIFDLSELKNDEVTNHLVSTKARLRSLQVNQHRFMSQRHEKCLQMERKLLEKVGQDRLTILFHPSHSLKQEFDESITLSLNGGQYIDVHKATHKLRILMEALEIEQKCFGTKGDNL